MVGCGVKNPVGVKSDILSSILQADSGGDAGTATVKAVGLNNYAQLGDGTKNQALPAVDVVGVSGVITVSAGRLHTVFLLGAPLSSCCEWACFRQ